MNKQNTAVTQQKDKMVQLKGRLLEGDVQTAIAEQLPKHMDPLRFARVAYNAVRTDGKLQGCTTPSVIDAVLEAAILGLEIDSVIGHCYLIPFKNKATLVIGYQGMLELAYGTGKVKTISAACVYENEPFQYTEGLNPSLEHEPMFDVPIKDRGPFKCAYAVAHMLNGGKIFRVVSAEEMNKVRGKSGPWKDYPQAMEQKTAIRRLFKLLPCSPEVRQAVNMDEMRDLGIRQSTSDSIDITAREVPMDLDDLEAELNHFDDDEPLPMEDGAVVCEKCGAMDNIGPNGLCSPCQTEADNNG